MSTTPHRKTPDGKAAGARARGAIQQGETGDKAPGFDPAAAPMETDGEAGGHAWPETANHVPPPSPAQAGDSNASSHASGLRPFEAESPNSYGRKAYLIGWLVVLSLAAAAYIVTLWLWR